MVSPSSLAEDPRRSGLASCLGYFQTRRWLLFQRVCYSGPLSAFPADTTIHRNWYQRVRTDAPTHRNRFQPVRAPMYRYIETGFAACAHPYTDTPKHRKRFQRRHAPIRRYTKTGLGARNDFSMVAVLFELFFPRQDCPAFATLDLGADFLDTMCMIVFLTVAGILFRSFHHI